MRAATNYAGPWVEQAAVAGKRELMELLIKSKADLNVKDTVYQRNALHHAAFGNQAREGGREGGRKGG